MSTHSFISLLIVLNFVIVNYGYDIGMPMLKFLDSKFLVAIRDNPDIKSVEMYVNINKEFAADEQPQLTCFLQFPRLRLWTCEFQERLLDSDVVYTDIRVQHDHVQYRDKKGGFLVGAIRHGNPNFVVTTTTTTTTEPPTKKPPRPGCQPSITEISTFETTCQGDLIFEDNFNEFSSKHWTDEVRIPTNNIDAEFSFYNGSISVDRGILIIQANVYATDTPKGTLDLLDRCTSNKDNECYFNVRNSFYPPIASGRINTKGKFQFKYGRIEVKAKLPIGDWLFPLISLQAADEKYGVDDYANGEMRIAFIRGNGYIPWDNTDIGGKRLFGGAILDKLDVNRTRYMSNVTLAQVNDNSEHFGKEFHVYSLTWKSNELLLSVDGYEYGRIPGDFKNILKNRNWRRNAPANAPLDQKFYVTLGLAAGGHGDFPDNILNKKWGNTAPKAILYFFNDLNTWLPTWIQPTLEVDYVRVYAI